MNCLRSFFRSLLPASWVDHLARDRHEPRSHNSALSNSSPYWDPCSNPRKPAKAVVNRFATTCQLITPDPTENRWSGWSTFFFAETPPGSAAQDSSSGASLTDECLCCSDQLKNQPERESLEGLIKNSQYSGVMCSPAFQEPQVLLRVGDLGGTIRCARCPWSLFKKSRSARTLVGEKELHYLEKRHGYDPFDLPPLVQI